MRTKADLFEQLRLLCYSKAEVAKLIGISKQKMYQYSSKKYDMPDPIREKILQLIAGGKNKKFVNRSILIQKAAKEHKMAIVAAKKSN